MRIPIYKESLYSTHKRACLGKTQLIKAKSSQGIIKLKISIKILILKLRRAGFCDKLGNSVTCFQLFIIPPKRISF